MDVKIETDEEILKKANVIKYQHQKDGRIDKIAKSCNLDPWKKYITPNMHCKKVSLKFDSDADLCKFINDVRNSK